MLVARYCTILFALALLAGSPTAALAETRAQASGPLVDLQLTTANPTDGAFAKVLVTEHDGGSTVTLTVTNIRRSARGTTFGAHVHVGGCVEGNGSAAGPHFNIGGAASPSTEVWLDFTVRGRGIGSAVAQVPFIIPDGGAGSIVIHALPTDPTGAAGARLACIGVAL